MSWAKIEQLRADHRFQRALSVPASCSAFHNTSKANLPPPALPTAPAYVLLMLGRGTFWDQHINHRSSKRGLL